VSWLRRSPRTVALPFPRLDGSTWPERHGASFAAATLHSLAQQAAFSAEAHDVADVVLEELVPMLDDGASPADEAYMAQVCSSAAQLGAGVGIVEVQTAGDARATASAERVTGRDAAAALWLAAEELPPMQPRQKEVARYLLQCGYYLARCGPDRVLDLTGALWEEGHPAVRPGHRPGPEH
jgi:hypothetical protein